jgi:hypothetical protein
VELVGANIDSKDAARAMLQEAIGKTACGGADIEAAEPLNIEGITIKGALEFFAATRDKARLCREDYDGIFGNGLRGFGGALPIDGDLACHNEALG